MPEQYTWTQDGDYETLLRPNGTALTTLTEPEDRTSGRDLSPVSVELNALLTLILAARDVLMLRVEEMAKKGSIPGYTAFVIHQIDDFLAPPPSAV